MIKSSFLIVAFGVCNATTKKKLVEHQTQQLGKRILSCMIYHEKKKTLQN